MGLIDYKSRNPVGLAIPPSEYYEEFVASINAFINNLEMIDNVILNNLANQNKAPYELIKKRAKNKELIDAKSNTQLTRQHSNHSTHGQLRTKILFHSHSKFANKQSALCQSKSKTFQPVQKAVHLIHCKMNRRSETRGFKGHFIPSELKSSHPQNKSTPSRLIGGKDRRTGRKAFPIHGGTKNHPRKERKSVQGNSQKLKVPLKYRMHEKSYRKRRKPERSQTFQKSFLAIIRRNNGLTRQRKKKTNQD